MRVGIFNWLLIVSSCAGLAGCGASESLGRLPIKGTVIMDGEPLDHGAIDFKPQGTGAHLVGAGAVIEDGKFSIPADQGLIPGKYMVSISAPDKEGAGGPGTEQSPEAAMNSVANAPPINERLPAKYNATTELMKDVTSPGPNEFEFKVESIKK
ncbi:MAG: hypothetical protein JWM11_951 [Planctomycetaceae bacterium]|nr:hypothetical protein [Planctomycetaceae bacterium]